MSQQNRFIAKLRANFIIVIVIIIIAIDQSDLLFEYKLRSSDSSFRIMNISKIIA